MKIVAWVCPDCGNEVSSEEAGEETLFTCNRCDEGSVMKPIYERRFCFKMSLTLVMVLAFFGCGIRSYNRAYNAITPCNLVILDKRYIPGFTAPDKFLLKVREADEYRWLRTTSSQYSTLSIGDTLKTVLITQLQ